MLRTLLLFPLTPNQVIMLMLRHSSYALLLLASTALAQGNLFDKTKVELEALAQDHPDRLRLEEWGRSRGKRPILVASLGHRPARPVGEPADARSAILLVAGLDGRRLDDVEVALDAIRRFATCEPGSRWDKILANHTLYVVPMANPDGLAQTSTGGLGIEGNGSPHDADRDGREGEDPPDDLDGDRQIALLRYPDPKGEWLVDPKEGRSMRKADSTKGERGTHTVVPEGRDDDGDEQLNEDAPGGVRIDNNFPHLYPEHQAGAGRFVLSEPEALALVKLVLGKQNLRLVVCYGAHDNLLEQPTANTATGRSSPTGVLEEDSWIYEQLGEQYRAATERKGKNREDWAGRFHAWVYAQAGLPCLTTRLEQLGESESVDKDKAGDKDEDKDKQEPSETERLVSAFGEQAVVAWHAVDVPGHPGAEVGGVIDGYRHRLTPARLDEIARSHTDFLASLFDRLPSLAITKASVKKLDDGVVEIESLVTNEAFLPPTTEMAKKLRTPRPPILELLLEIDGQLQRLQPELLLLGQRRGFLNAIAGKGSHESLRWIVRVPDRGKLVLRLTQSSIELARREVVVR